MRLLRRPRRGQVATVLLAAGLGVGSSAATTDLHADAATSAPVIFATGELIPGDTVTGNLSLPSGHITLAPYLEAVDLVDGCVSTSRCAATGPRLSDTLLLSVTAPDGETFHVTPRQLVSAARLPGGDLPAHSGVHTYAVTMTLPAAATDSSAGRTVGFELRYGGMDAAGARKTAVLGETFAAGHGDLTPAGAQLPHTGADIAAEAAVGVALLLTGGILVATGRRRRRT